MKVLSLGGLLLLAGCQVKTNPVSGPADAELPRQMTTLRASLREVPDQPGARLVTWETNYHSCDPFQSLTVKRTGNTVNIEMLTNPPPGACTTESGSMQKVGLILPAGTFYTEGYQRKAAVTVRLNGQEIGVVNPE